MLHGRNIQNLLEQTARPVSTTEKSILAVGITLPNGSLLSSYIHSPNNEVTITRLKIFSLFCQRQLDQSNAQLKKFGIQDEDEPLEVYIQLIPKTEYAVLIVTELDYPDGLISLKLKSLLDNLTELEQFEFTED